MTGIQFEDKLRCRHSNETPATEQRVQHGHCYGLVKIDGMPYAIVRWDNKDKELCPAAHIEVEVKQWQPITITVEEAEL